MDRLYNWLSSEKLMHFSAAVIKVFAVLYVIAVFIGLTNLANVVLTDVIQTVLLTTILWALHYVIKSNLRVMIKVMRGYDDEKTNESLLLYWLTLSFDVVIFIAWALAMLMIWGIERDVLFAWLYLITFKGVKVGETSFSITYLLKAVVIFFVVYYVMRLILRLIEKKVLPYTRFDQGTKDAISTVFGYAGLLLAIVIGVYALGISSTSLAFIVSAFTFGLSFGLKEIFNNFISGIILFIERPIKVGDWVDVGGESGVVKNIKLRATTVETFARKTLLIPNSQFITSTVSNDLYNPIARSEIVIECGYDDDPIQVRDLLLSIVADHPKVKKSPAPVVLFMDFNESGLGFALRFFCMTEDRTNLTSEIRYTIIEKFREAGLEIPYPKRDIYIKEQPAAVEV
ncbi:MAG: mechanosensitive ion channel [Coxiellaceae bacterium]|nr:mechanosensitive ion channel [Coxiellaceae bacterium]